MFAIFIGCDGTVGGGDEATLSQDFEMFSFSGHAINLLKMADTDYPIFQISRIFQTNRHHIHYGLGWESEANQSYDDYPVTEGPNSLPNQLHGSNGGSKSCSGNEIQ